jgi:hypothetical protein
MLVLGSRPVASIAAYYMNTLHLLYIHLLSIRHYGCELWDLKSSKLSEYCAAWKKGFRRVWVPEIKAPPPIWL